MYSKFKDISTFSNPGALDVIVIRRVEDDGDVRLFCSPFHVRLGKPHPPGKDVYVSVNANPIPFRMKTGDAGDAFFLVEFEDEPYMPVEHSRPYVYKTLRLTSDQLKTLDLKYGANKITFSLSAEDSHPICKAQIFLWNYTDRIIVSEVEETITKSDGLGHIFQMIGRNWAQPGVAKLYTNIAGNGYKILYLTSRTMGQVDLTRDYLHEVEQDGHCLPEGPVIMRADRFEWDEVMRNPAVFKMASLRDTRMLFGEGESPFFAGFGNRVSDVVAYRSIDIPSSRIFTIYPSGDVEVESPGHKSSYIEMSLNVDRLFPPLRFDWVE